MVVSRLRLWSSSTNTAAHREDLKIIENIFDKSRQLPFGRLVLCEFNPLTRKLCQKELNQFQAPVGAKGKRDRNPFCLAGPMSPCPELISSHPWGQALQAPGFWSNSELSHCAAHPKHAPSNTQSSNEKVTMRICSHSSMCDQMQDKHVIHTQKLGCDSHTIPFSRSF